MIGQLLLFDFSTNVDSSRWKVVDDGVMGGRSNGRFEINENGNGMFYGKVSLENNGGFSSLRHRFPKQNVVKFEKVNIRIKGDGKRYQFRIKSSLYQRHSYIYYFQTTGDWQTISIPFSEMYPAFRGVRLSTPNYPGKMMEEIAFLIGNKRAEKFRLEIDHIILE